MREHDPILVELLGHRVKLQIRLRAERRPETVAELNLVERGIAAYRTPTIRFLRVA